MAIEQIKKAIADKENFLLSGGAGSGKTYTLMQTLEEIYKDSIHAKVACITYTNVAAKEILSRSPYANLTVATIHDFLWGFIKSFQKNIKLSIVHLIAEGKINNREEVEITIEYLKTKRIKYLDYKKLSEGIISHNDVIKIAEYLFKTYPLINDIIKDKFNYILIDEYQDTQKEVARIVLEHFKLSTKVCVLGFFGDSMQSIYNGRTENLKDYIDDGVITEIIKEDNYRCSISVINLLNKLRTDIEQRPATENIEGSCKFIYSSIDDLEIKDLKTNEAFNGWDFEDTIKTKELYLTHKLIAKQKGFRNLLESELSNDDITGDNPSRIIKHLLKIAQLISHYQEREFNQFLRKTEYEIHTHQDKETLKNNIENLLSPDSTIEHIIENSNELKLIVKDDKLLPYLETNGEKYDSIKEINSLK